MPALHVVNDTIVPAPFDPYIGGLSPRETSVRNAFFIIALGAPIVGAIFAVLADPKWRLRKSFWSYERLSALWFISVSVFAIMVYIFPGQVNRSTITIAVVHEMIEIMIVFLLLDRTASEGLLAAMTLGLVGLSIVFGLKDVSWVYFIAVILGGIGDFMMPLLLFYGQQPLLAIGSLGHVSSAALVFANFAHNYGIINFNLFSFWALWIYVGFVVTGLRLQDKPEQPYPTNPMKREVPKTIFVRLFLTAIVVSVAISTFFSFIAPKL